MGLPLHTFLSEDMVGVERCDCGGKWCAGRVRRGLADDSDSGYQCRDTVPCRVEEEVR